MDQNKQTDLPNSEINTFLPISEIIEQYGDVEVSFTRHHRYTFKYVGETSTPGVFVVIYLDGDPEDDYDLYTNPTPVPISALANNCILSFVSSIN